MDLNHNQQVSDAKKILYCLVNPRDKTNLPDIIKYLIDTEDYMNVPRVYLHYLHLKLVMGCTFTEITRKHYSYFNTMSTKEIDEFVISKITDFLS